MSFLIPAMLFSIGSIIIMIAFLRIPRTDQNLFRWMVGVLLLMWALSLTFTLPTDWQPIRLLTPSFVSSVTAMVMTLAFSNIILSLLTHHPRRQQYKKFLSVVAVIWIALYVASEVIVPELSATSTPIPLSTVPMIIALAGVGVIGISLILILLWDYYKLSLPELANRSAFWILNSLFFCSGVAFILSTLPSLALPGLTLIYLALIGLVYGYGTIRILDVRAGLVSTTRNIAILMLLSVMLLASTYLIDRFDFTESVAGTVGVVSLAIIIAALALPLLQLIRDIFQRLTATVETNLSLAITAYSREVSLSTNLEELVSATTNTLNHVLNIKRSGLILINNTFRRENAVEFVVLGGIPGADGLVKVAYISKTSPLYHNFAVRRLPLTQFDIDFDPKYASLSDEERNFFQSLYLRAYAPIVTEDNLIGIIGCGPKLNDTAYTRSELELLLVIGQQVGTALRSARLIDDLRHLNNSMRSLNTQLQIAKQDLEKLDSIKTDFVTIASHELRTPLAQVRGYSDIIDSLNEQGILDQKQTTNLVNNLRRATERIEELISAMMDVSQLDVNAMDLRFVRTKPDTIIKLAIDPLAEAIKQRKLTVETRGLSELPAIQADMQRIVQAFSNIIVNAVKFTPDGGKIEISGSIVEKPDEDTNHVLITIKDNGVGVHPQDRELIFQKFYRGFDPQLHSTGSYKFMGAGPGLGTTIAKGIIEGHGGKIWVESPGHDVKAFPGSTFYISMPINPPEDARRVLLEGSESSDDQETSEIPPVTVEHVAIVLGDVDSSNEKAP